MNNKKEKDAAVADLDEDCNGDWVTVSKFNYYVENQFKPMETISKLCEEVEEDDDYALQQTEIQCLSFSVTLLTMLLLLLCMYVSS